MATLRLDHPVKRLVSNLLWVVVAAALLLAAVYFAFAVVQAVLRSEIERFHEPAAALADKLATATASIAPPAGVGPAYLDATVDPAAFVGQVTRGFDQALDLTRRLAELYRAENNPVYAAMGRRVTRARDELAQLAERHAGHADALARDVATRPLYAALVALQVQRLHDGASADINAELERREHGFRATLVALCIALLGAAAWQARRSLRGIDTLLDREAQTIASLRQTEASLNEAQRMAQVGNWVHDLATGSLSWSAEMFRITEIDPAPARTLYAAYRALIHPDDAAQMDRTYAKAMAERTPYESTYRLAMRASRIKHVVERGVVFHDEAGRPLRAVGTLQDVTERVLAQTQLRDSEERFRSAFEDSPLGIALLSTEGVMFRCNQAFCDMVGYSQQELARLSFSAITHPGDLGRNLDLFRATLRGEMPGYSYEKRFLHKDGRVVWTALSTVAVRDLQGRTLHLISQIQDITARRAADAALREAHDRLDAVLSAVPDLWFVVDADGRYLDISDPSHPSLAAPWDAMRGQAFGTVLPEPIARLTEGALQRARASRQPVQIEYALTTISGAARAFEARIVPMRNGQWLYLTRDITERQQAQAQLRAALAEKEMLLKEIYHRVKNNLQVVASLLSLQGSTVRDKTARGLLKDGADRIKSMALVHEQLYQTGDLTNIAFDKYIAELAQHLMHTHGDAARRVPVRCDIAPVSLGIETAIPLGLIVNELVANAYRHAFRDRSAGEIEIRMRAVGADEFELAVADDGVGLPPDFLPRQSASLGMQLVRSLTEQLGGTFAHAPNGVSGTRFSIRFRPDEPERLRLSPDIAQARDHDHEP